MTTQEIKKQSKFKNSISLKLIIVVALSLFLLIPSTMVRKLIDEREGRKNEAIREITSKWGSKQTLSGPILLVPYEKVTRYKNGTHSTERDYFQILPSELNVNGELETEEKKRGIYTVLIYKGDFKITGTFKSEDFIDWPEKYDYIIWDEAKIVLGISDTKGINKTATLNWNGANRNFSPGKSNCELVRYGMNTEVKVNMDSPNNFAIDLSLNGSKSMYFTPLGKETNVKLQSNWNNPIFDGWYITSNNEVKENGFIAEWNMNEMTRAIPQIIKGSGYSNNEVISDYNYDSYNGYSTDSGNQSFGVDLKLPVDTYQKSERSVKYAFLFIALTFLIIFFAEITGKLRVHPIQYLIIGLALVIFYSLLIALAEHITFNFAYLVASLVIIAMIILYTQALFKKWKNTLAVGAFLVLLYVFLFTILQIADYALILGNIGLVIILGLVMFFSKKVDWYGSQNTVEENQ
jgi:inner membrane protein